MALKNNKATPIVSIEWMKLHFYSINEIKSDTLKLDGAWYWPLRYRLSSNKRLKPEEIKIWTNELEALEEKSYLAKRIVVQIIKQATGSTLYIYDIFENIKLFEKTNVVKATYKNYSSPKAYIWLKQMPYME